MYVSYYIMGNFNKKAEKNSKRFKKIIFFSLVVLFLTAIVFFPNTVFADWATTQEMTVYASNVSQIISIVSHIVYVFIWPCLAIAGLALDNSLIYGSFLHLDAALWSIWNIMKNFANFTLWFVFVFTIVKNLFAWSFGGSGDDPMQGAVKTIKRTLIAWVLVQMSWFIVAALIDLSTILIYAVWWLPLSMVWSYDHEVAKTPIMQLNTEFNNNDVSFYYSYWWHNFSQCFLANKQGSDVDPKDNAILQWQTWQEYIAWRKYLYMLDWSEFDTWYCVLNGYLYKYEESSWFFGSEGSEWVYKKSWDTVSASNKLYLNQLIEYLETWNMDIVEQEKASCFLINAYNKEYTWGNNNCEEVCAWYWEVPRNEDVFSWWVVEDQFTLDQLMENSKWWVWPFITMYSSILNYQDLVIDPGNRSVMWNLFGLLINTFFALVLFIPMAILMILLIMRIGYLWVVVAISPILVLVEFGLDDKMKKKFTLLSDKFKIENVLKTIFAPILVVFTVSLSIVFLTAIFETKPNYDNAADTLNAFWIEPVSVTERNDDNCSSWGKKVTMETYSIMWLVTVTLNAQNYNHWMNMFARVIVEFLATWVVRFFMKFAIWAMWKKWEELMEQAGKFLGSVPIVPLPGGKWAIGVSKLKDIWPSAILENYTNELNRESDKVLEKAFPWAYPWHNKSDSEETESWTVSSVDVSKVVEEIGHDKDRVVPYAELSPTSKATLTSLYGTEAKAIEHYEKFVEYHVTNKNSTIMEAGKTLSKDVTVTKTNADALQFTRVDLDAAVKADPNWKAWASGMIWWSVQTKDWVYMVDIVKWTEQNPIYCILSRDDYEERHFGKKIETIDKKTYEDNRNDIEKYLKELSEELGRLRELEQEKQTNWQLSPENQKLYEKLQAMEAELMGKDYELDEIKNALGLNTNN